MFVVCYSKAEYTYGMNILSPFWSTYDEQKKILLAFEFAIVLSDAAHQLKIEMTKEIVLKAEEILKSELVKKSPESFSCQMNGLALAVLEPVDTDTGTVVS